MTDGIVPVPGGPTARVEPVRRVGYSTAWWGMATVIATEGMIFLGLLATYFFLRATAKFRMAPMVRGWSTPTTSRCRSSVSSCNRQAWM